MTFSLHIYYITYLINLSIAFLKLSDDISPHPIKIIRFGDNFMI